MNNELITYICPYCNQEKHYKNSNGFIAHKKFCKFNPDYEKNMIQIRNAAKLGGSIGGLRNKKQYDILDPFEEHETECQKCHTIFKYKIRHSRYIKNKIPKFCSIKCSHSNKHNDIIKSKISESLKKYCKSDKYKELCKKKYNREYECIICHKKFKSKNKRSTCSKECYSKILKQIYLERKKNGTFKGWQSRNIISYPEKFWIKVLQNNNIEYIKEFYIKKYKYFLDFVININNLKIDLEIDGSQHWNIEERYYSDKRRDKILKKLGYIVYRIRWNDINNKIGSLRMKYKIREFLFWLKRINSNENHS